MHIQLVSAGIRLKHIQTLCIYMQRQRQISYNRYFEYTYIHNSCTDILFTVATFCLWPWSCQQWSLGDNSRNQLASSFLRESILNEGWQIMELVGL